GDDQYLDPAFVRGYVRAATSLQKPQQQMILTSGDPPLFPEQSSDVARTLFHEDPHPDWQVGFFRRMKQADAVLIRGGAEFAFLTGLAAEALGKKVLPIKPFGGGGCAVWNTLEAQMEREDRDATGPSWQTGRADELARRVVESHNRRIAEERQRQ